MAEQARYLFDSSNVPAFPRCVTDLLVRTQPRKDHIAGRSCYLRDPYSREKQDGLLLRASSKNLKSAGVLFHVLVWGFFPLLKSKA